MFNAWSQSWGAEWEPHRTSCRINSFLAEIRRGSLRNKKQEWEPFGLCSSWCLGANTELLLKKSDFHISQKLYLQPCHSSPSDAEIKSLTVHPTKIGTADLLIGCPKNCVHSRNRKATELKCLFSLAPYFTKSKLDKIMEFVIISKIYVEETFDKGRLKTVITLKQKLSRHFHIRWKSCKFSFKSPH
jgi:hypothetical protein